MAEVKRNLTEQGWTIEYPADAEMGAGRDDQDPIIFAARFEVESFPAYNICEDRGTLLARLVEGQGVIWVTGLPAMQFSDWSRERDRFARQPSLVKKELVKLSVNQEQLARTLAVSTAPGDSDEKKPEDVELRAIFDVKSAVLQDATETYAFFRDQYSLFATILLPLMREEL